MTIVLVTPARRGSRRGNRVTALRWAAHLRALGHRVKIREAWDGVSCDALVALHAEKSAASVERFRRERPEGALVVGIAGTDLYTRGLGDVARRALQLASRIVLLQPRAADGLPPELRTKARTILQSATSIPGDAPDAAAFDVCVVGHLREIKDPFRTALAARTLSASSKVRVVHVGAALSDDMAARAREEEAANPRYRWLGELTRRETLCVVARSRLLALTSFGEGGANAISEAVAAGVPIVASRIAGNTGLLGDDHPGLYPAGDTDALAALLRRAETDAAFLAELRERSARLRPLFDPARERRAWAGLFAELRLERDFAASIRDGLTSSPKSLACRWFYDEEGSALFEEICDVPEYYIPAAETEILAAHADEIAASVPHGAAVFELGSGSARKTRLVLEAALRRGGRVRYVPIDISFAALDDSERALRAEYRELDVDPVLGEYEDGIERIRETPGAKLVLWLGSNIGNLTRDDAAAFLGRVAGALGPSDRLLVGIDLRKDEATLERAYDDARGVTARFDLNLLARVNRQLGGHFDLAGFRHRARYLEREGRIEMHLVAQRAMTVRIDALGLDVAFAAGEPVHTEDSTKYAPDEIASLALAAGLRVERQWTDRRGLFVEVLFARERASPRP